MIPDPKKLAHDAIFGVKSPPVPAAEAYSGEMETETVEEARVLGAEDRCDRCGAAAGGYAELPDGSELLFCDHHLRGNADALKDFGARVVGLEVFIT